MAYGYVVLVARVVEYEEMGILRLYLAKAGWQWEVGIEV
jgi:hypothetical protein